MASEAVAPTIPAPGTQGLRSRLRAAWRGDATLGWSFWGFHFGGGLLILFLAAFCFLFLLPFAYSEGQGIAASPVFRTYLVVVGVAYLLYVIAAFVMVWRCSFNVEQRAFGYVARALMIYWIYRVAAGIWGSLLLL